ncbi:MAG: hypothetical protein AAGD00_04100 [Planctomycetota bacterium]
MHRLALIVIAALASLAATAPADAFTDSVTPLDEPVRVAFRTLGDNARIRGEVVGISDTRFWLATNRDADAGLAPEPDSFAWADLEPRDAFNIRRKLLDARPGTGAADWVRLARDMLVAADDPRTPPAPTARLATRALTVAKRLEPSLADDLDAIARAITARGSGPFDDALDRLDSLIAPPDEPGTGDDADQRRGAIDFQTNANADAPPWAALTDEEHDARTKYLREVSRQMLATIGMRLNPVETRHYLLYSDLQPAELRRWARVLDGMYDTLCTTLEIPLESRLFAGKCVIFIFRERATFLAFERGAFNYDATRAAGVCHMHGENVFICFYRQDNEADFQSVLVHETVHGFMHRYRSPHRLPTWADEGLADYVAGHLTPVSQEPQRHWTVAQRYVNNGGSPMEIMNQTYRDGTWFNQYSYPVSHMLVRFMLKHEPRAFKLWIDDIKRGEDWKASMADRFNVDPPTLAQGFADDIRREPGYRKLK